MSEQDPPFGWIDEGLRRRFESAWAEGQPERMEQLLPAEDDDDYLLTLVSLICIGIELTWRGWAKAKRWSTTGADVAAKLKPPLVESYVERFPRLGASEIVLRLLAWERLIRKRYGDQPTIAEYQRRFPKLAITGQRLQACEKELCQGERPGAGLPTQAEARSPLAQAIPPLPRTDEKPPLATGDEPEPGNVPRLVYAVVGFLVIACGAYVVYHFMTVVVLKPIPEPTEQPEDGEWVYSRGRLLFQGSPSAGAPTEPVAERERRDSSQRAALRQSDTALARSLRDAGKYEDAEKLLLMRLEELKKTGGVNTLDHAKLLNNLGVLCREQGEYAKSGEHLDQALSISRQVGGPSHPLTARTLTNVGTLCVALGDYEKAEECLSRALGIHKARFGVRSEGYVLCLTHLALVYQEMGRYREALPAYQEALDLWRQTGREEHPDYIACLNLLGVLHAEMLDYDHAKVLLNQALECQRRLRGENHPGYATSLSLLAQLYLRTEDYDRAEDLYQQAGEVLKNARAENSEEYARVLNELAMVHYEQGATGLAESLLARSSEMTRQVLGESHPNYAARLMNLAACVQAGGDHRRALDLCRKGRRILERSLPPAHPDLLTVNGNLAEAHYFLGNYAQAETLVSQTLDGLRRHLEVMATVQSERQQRQAEWHLRAVLSMYLLFAPKANVSAAAIYAKVLDCTGTVFLRRRALRLSRVDRELAPSLEELQRTSAQLAALYRAAPETAEREDWLRRIAQLVDAREELEQRLSRQSEPFRNEQASLSLSPDGLQELLPPESALVHFIMYFDYQFDESTGRRKREMTPGLLAFVVRADQPVVRVDLGPLASIHDAVLQWLRAILPGSNLPPQEVEAASQAVRRSIWQPLEEYVEDAGLLLVTPDALLMWLPFGALPGKASGTFLLEERQIALIPVPGFLPAMLRGSDGEADKDVADGALLLVGDVDFDASPGFASPADRPRSAAAPGEVSFPPLPGTAAEIEAIRDLHAAFFSNGAATLLRGAGATEQTFRQKAPEHACLHLATHGFFVPRVLESDPTLPVDPHSAALFSSKRAVLGFHPELASGLVLAGANRGPEATSDFRQVSDDGIQTAMEIGTLDLRGVDLAVLSACATAMGGPTGGEGMLSLQRALQIAGARTTIASLWKVDDHATKALMVEFYRNLWQKKLGKLEALRQAQLTMLRAYDPKTGALRGPGAIKPVDPAKLAEAREMASRRRERLSPFYWAAFVLSGDWR